MKVVFRADASLNIGSGHVMRCLSLAAYLADTGAQVHFLCAEQPGQMAAQIRDRGFACTLIATPEMAPESLWPATLQQQHAEHCAAHLAGCDWLIVDHYGLSAPFEQAAAEHCQQLMVIDDLANRPHHCQLLLDCNPLPASRYQQWLETPAQLLCGPQFALLRQDFNRLRQQGLKTRQQPRRLLVFCGGMDPDNLSYDILNAIIARQQAGAEHQVDLVIGAANPHRQQLAEICQLHGFQLHVQTARMAELMAQADLALGAGGSSHWERCMLGLPAIVCSLAANQEHSSQALAQLGACEYLGRHSQLTWQHWQQALAAMSTTRLQTMARAASQVIGADDGCPRVLPYLFTAGERH